MSVHERCPEREQLEGLLETLAPLLERRAPQPLSEIRQRVARLRARRWRIVVGGAQGNGKSSLVRAVLTSEAEPAPPVPVSEREETRIPVLYRKGRQRVLREVGPGGTRTFDGPFDERDVQARASADRRFFDRVRFGSLDALEVELPGIALEEGMDLVDLPGVAGNLATVSAWAVRNLLESGSQGMIFVLAPSSTIEATDQEANLIRAFGPLMLRTLFVHNVWSDHDDDHDETERLNRQFLEAHVGRDVRYLRLDVRAALRAASAGDRSLLAPVLGALAPFFRGDVAAVVLDEAGRWLNLVDEVLRAVAVEALAAAGRAPEAARAAQAIGEERARVRAALDVLVREIHREVAAAEAELDGRLDAALTEVEGQLDAFVRDEDALQQDTFDREVARRVGALQRSVGRSLATEVRGLVERVRERSREVLGRARVEALPETEVGFDAPQLSFGLERQLLGLVKTGVGLGGAAAGAWIGAEVGLLGGPLGVVVGGIAGAAIGWLASFFLDSVVGSTLSDWEREHVRRELQTGFARARAEGRAGVRRALASVTAQLVAAVQAFRDDREAVFVHQVREVRASEDVAAALAAERRQLEQIRAALGSLVATGGNG